MRDLQELIGSVRSPDAQAKFKEAVTAYQSGALRSAIISTWVAVVFDLNEKLMSLADAGDPEAQQDVEKLRNAVDHGELRFLQRFENDLLDKAANKYEMLNPRERDELERLFKDRNLCAHPAYVEFGKPFAPAPELVRSHMAVAVDAVLSQRPTVGKHAIDRLFREMSGNSWPSGENVRTYLAEEYLDRGRQAMRRGVAEALVKGVIEPPEGGPRIADRCVEAVQAMQTVDGELLDVAIESVLRKRHNAGSLGEEHLVRIVGGLGNISATWRAVDNGVRSRVVAVLRNSDTDFLVANRGFAFMPAAHAEVAEIVHERLHHLGVEQLDELTERRAGPSYVAVATAELARSPSFRGAEARMRIILRLAEHVELSDLTAISDAVLGNDQVRLASAIPNSLVSLFEETKAVPGALESWGALADELDARADDDDPYYSYPDLNDRVRVERAKRTAA